jgi:hypothetical protein
MTFSLPKESIPSFCFGRIMGMCPYSDGMETWYWTWSLQLTFSRPIIKTRGFKIGSDATLCNAVIDYNNADPVHLILVNESDLGLEWRKSRIASHSAEASLKSTLANKSSGPTNARTISSRSRSSIANIAESASNDLVPEMNIEQSPALCTIEHSDQEVDFVEDSPLSFQDPNIMEIDNSEPVASEKSTVESSSNIALESVGPIPSTTLLSSSTTQNQNTEGSILKTDHLGNSWYVKVVGRTGVYINNFYHGCISESESANPALVKVKSGDHLRIGEWLGTLYFT